MQTQGIVPVIVPLHILAGVLALMFGYVALYATKGATLHRKSGMLFVYAMVVMSLSGALMETLVTWRFSVNVVAGLLTFYLVTTALRTVSRRPRESFWIDRAALGLVLVVSVFAFISASNLARAGRPETAPAFIFGLVGMLAAAGDIRMMRAGAVQGSPRVARHLWRMCFAMWVAAASFFWGPPRRIPEMLRIPALQAVAVLIPIAAMLYWLWRIRVRETWLERS